MEQKSTKSQLPTNVVFMLKNVFSKRYLRCGLNDKDQENTIARTSRSGASTHYQWLFWYLQKSPNGNYLIRNTLSQRYLKSGADNSNQYTTAYSSKSGFQFHQNNIDWTFQAKNTNQYVLKNTLSQRYLRAGSGQDELTNAQTTIRGTQQHGEWVIWQFIPVNNVYHVDMKNFTFENIEEVLNSSSILPSLIGADELTVSEYTVGSYAERTYQKTLKDSFSYTLNQSFGLTGSMTFSFGVPLVASTQIMIQGNAQWGSSNTWTHQQSNTISIKVHLQPSAPGKYRMSGWIDIIKNAEFEYSAQSTFAGKACLINSEGNLVQGQDLDADQIESILRASQDGSNLVVISTTDKTVTVKTTGKMRGTYGSKSYTTFDKIQ